MKKIASTSLSKRFRFPPEIIRHCVWLYFRFSLSFRDIEELMAERGIVLTYETIRQWGLKFGQAYANELKRHRGKTGDTWHLDEMFLKINSKQHSLWRAVDQHGNVLDILVQSRAFQESREKGLPQIAQRPPVRAASYHH
jgi:putative transposase